MKLKATPPKATDDDREERIAAIISGATAASPAPTPPPTPTPAQSPAPEPASRSAVAVPWKGAKVRDDLLVQVNVRLPEPLALKLAHVAHMTDKLKQELVAEALGPLLDKRLRELGYSKEDL